MIEYWYNEAIEKYQFKFWCPEEDAYIGFSNPSIEDGLDLIKEKWNIEEETRLLSSAG